MSSKQLRSYVVTLEARHELSEYDFCVNPRFGVHAFAVATAYSSAYHFCGFASKLVVETIARNCSDERDAIDLNVLKYEPSPQGGYSSARLSASIRSANQRLREASSETFGKLFPGASAVPGGTSVAAMMPSASGIVTMQVGTMSRIYRIRGQQIEQLSPSPDLQLRGPGGIVLGLPPPYLSLGVEAEFDVLIQEHVSVPGDLYVLGRVDAFPGPGRDLSPLLEVLAEHSTNFEHALAACFERIQRDAIVIARRVE